MSAITDKDNPNLENDRNLLKSFVEFYKRGLEFKQLPSGEFEVDPETFYGIIPGEAEKGPEDKQGLAWFRKNWGGVRFCCHWFE
ncbi:hypothetical protein [Acidaminococcus massiliensis]